MAAAIGQDLGWKADNYKKGSLADWRQAVIGALFHSGDTPTGTWGRNALQYMWKTYSVGAVHYRPVPTLDLCKETWGDDYSGPSSFAPDASPAASPAPAPRRYFQLLVQEVGSRPCVRA